MSKSALVELLEDAPRARRLTESLPREPRKRGRTEEQKRAEFERLWAQAEPAETVLARLDARINTDDDT